jgi:hypothetical protein
VSVQGINHNSGDVHDQAGWRTNNLTLELKVSIPANFAGVGKEKDLVLTLGGDAIDPRNIDPDSMSVTIAKVKEPIDITVIGDKFVEETTTHISADDIVFGKKDIIITEEFAGALRRNHTVFVNIADFIDADEIRIYEYAKIYTDEDSGLEINNVQYVNNGLSFNISRAAINEGATITIEGVRTKATGEIQREKINQGYDVLVWGETIARNYKGLDIWKARTPAGLFGKEGWGVRTDYIESRRVESPFYETVFIENGSNTIYIGGTKEGGYRDGEAYEMDVEAILTDGGLFGDRWMIEDGDGDGTFYVPLRFVVAGLTGLETLNDPEAFDRAVRFDPLTQTATVFTPGNTFMFTPGRNLYFRNNVPVNWTDDARGNPVFTKGMTSGDGYFRIMVPFRAFGESVLGIEAVPVFEDGKIIGAIYNP